MANQAQTQTQSLVSPTDHNVYAQYERNRPPPPVAPIPLPQPDENGVRRSTSNGNMMPIARQRLSSNNSRARPITMSEYSQGTANYSQFPPAQQPTPVPSRATGNTRTTMNGQTVVRSPSSPAMNSRHRTRANPLDVGTAAPIQPPPPLRDDKEYPLPPPAASAHRRSHSLSQKPEMSPPLPSANAPNMTTINEPESAPGNGRGGIARKFNSILHRQSTQEDAEVPRQRVNSTSSYKTAHRLSMLAKSGNKDREKEKTQAHNEAVNKLEGHSENASANANYSPTTHRRAYTVSEKKREPKETTYHDRNYSTGHPKTAVHTVGRYSGVGPWVQASSKKSAAQQPQAPGTPTAIEVMSRSSSNNNTHTPSEEVFDPVEEPKAVWGKGLFSVATTSTKSSNTLRSEIGDTLSKLGVNYRLTRLGFECIHQPSISVGGAGSKRLEGSGDYSIREKGDSSEHMKFGKFVRKKSSKLSFNSSKKASNHDDLGLEESGHNTNLGASKVRFEINIVRVSVCIVM